MGEKQECEVWLHEIAEEKYCVPKNRQELSQHICLLRERLLKIVDVYGHRSAEALIFSQFLDKFILEYQKLDAMKKSK